MKLIKPNDGRPAPSNSKQIDRSIGDQIATARKKIGLSSNSVAQHLGIRESEFKRIETGEVRARAEMLFRLSSHFGVPLSFFYLKV